MNNLSERELLFKNDVENFIKYDPIMRDEFCDYWTESNKSGTKMKWELQKTWDTKRRLKRWFDNQNKWSNEQASSKNGKAGIGKVTSEQLNKAFADFYSQGKPL